MFENVLAQEAARQLAADIAGGSLPGSLLFSGPSGSGKGTAALELARVLSCMENSGNWTCSCSACARHRELSHPDLLLIGPRAFAAEILACAAAYKRDGSATARLLFFRAVQKLQARFAPLLWEGEENRLGKAAGLSSSLEETLEQLRRLEPGTQDTALLHKLVDEASEDAIKLEHEGITDTIPIFQIRRLSAWARMAPQGKRKLIYIENADRMQEGARNALLKILEEPPASCVIILSCERKQSLLPTIQSRLRPYNFARRSVETEREVIRRVFRDPEAAGRGDIQLQAYLESFLPVPRTVLKALAAWFVSSVCAATKSGGEGSAEREAAIGALRAAADSLCQSLPELPPPVSDARSCVALIREKAFDFKERALYRAFLSSLLDCVSALLRRESANPWALALADSWSRAVRDSDVAAGSFNQSLSLALERLFTQLSRTLRPTRSPERVR